jgi:FixJ family two-component response regulator
MAGFTVFLVDDDVAVLRGLSRLLTAAGYDVRAYASPAAFLAEQDQFLSGCAILDLAMPGLDGLALHVIRSCSNGLSRCLASPARAARRHSTR